MTIRVLAFVSVAAAASLTPCACVAQDQTSGAVVGWGDNGYSQCDAPAPNEGFVAIAGGRYHSVGLKSDSTVVAWYYSMDGQCEVPPPNKGFTHVAAGYEHSLGVRSDSTIVAWGSNDDYQCDVPAPNSGFVGVAAGDYHSLGLRSDGTVVAWGSNSHGQCDVPESYSDFIAVAAGSRHSLGLRSDGSVVGWGHNTHGQCDAPSPNIDFVRIAAGNFHSIGLRSDGTIAAWGFNGYGQTDVPSPNADFIAVGAGYWHSLAARSDSTVAAWGGDSEGQCQIPDPNERFFEVAGGTLHSLAIRRSDTAVNDYFYATLRQEDGAVLLQWRLRGLPEGLALVVCRATSADGPFTCVTEEVLPCTSHGSYVDRSVWPGGTFWYELRVLLATGEERRATGNPARVTVPGSLTTGIRYVTPNPTASHAAVGLTLPRYRQTAELTIHDVSGRVVRTLVVPSHAVGFFPLEWDGRTDSGERVSSGVYLIRFAVDGSAATRSVVLLR
jgi:hypothetical protein